MNGQILDRTLNAYRIGDIAGAYPIYSAEGARLYPGRWNKTTSPMIYTSSSLSLSMLEKLAHSRIMPKNQHYINITIPSGIKYEIFPHQKYPEWVNHDCAITQDYGDIWARELRTPILIVPSVIVRTEHNYLINPTHPDFTKIKTSLHEPIHWDERLYI